MSYGTLAGFRAYALARGNTAPTTATDADANAALLRAQDYIQYSYVALFIGADSTAPEVEPATYEAAGIELSHPGFFTSTYTPAQQKVLVEVKGIRWQPVSTSTGLGAGADAMPRSAKIDAMLAKYMPGRFLVGMKSVGADYV